MAYFAFSTTRPVNREGHDAQWVESDCRKHILTTLENDTRQGRNESPAFEGLIQDATNNLEKILDTGPSSTTSTLDRDHKRKIAQDYLESLRAQYGQLNPKEGIDFSNVDPRASVLSSVFGGRRSGASGRTGRRTASNPDMRQTNSRPGSGLGLRKKSQEMLARFAARPHDTLEEER